MKINRGQYPAGTDTYIAKKGVISADRKPGAILWQHDKGRLYVTCRACNAINDITGHQNKGYTDGLDTSSCFVCTNCRTHYFFHLVGWEEPRCITCVDCGTEQYVVDKGEMRHFRKRGWTVNVERLTDSKCPDCVRVRRRRKG